MKVSTKIILILVLFYNYTPAQNEYDELYTKGYANGKYWEGLTLQEMIYYVTGLGEGVGLAKNVVGDSPEFDELIIKGFRMSDLAIEIDLFFEQRANIRIPIAYAYTYVIKKMKGDTAEELDEYIVWLRKFFNT